MTLWVLCVQLVSHSNVLELYCASRKFERETKVILASVVKVRSQRLLASFQLRTLTAIALSIMKTTQAKQVLLSMDIGFGGRLWIFNIHWALFLIL